MTMGSFKRNTVKELDPMAHYVTAGSATTRYLITGLGLYATIIDLALLSALRRYYWG